MVIIALAERNWVPQEHSLRMQLANSQLAKQRDYTVVPEKTHCFRIMTAHYMALVEGVL